MGKLTSTIGIPIKLLNEAQVCCFCLRMQRCGARDAHLACDLESYDMTYMGHARCCWVPLRMLISIPNAIPNRSIPLQTIQASRSYRWNISVNERPLLTYLTGTCCHSRNHIRRGIQRKTTRRLARAIHQVCFSADESRRYASPSSNALLITQYSRR